VARNVECDRCCIGTRPKGKTPVASLSRNTLLVSGVHVINGILGIIVIPVALTRLGVTGYGLFSTYGVLASFIGIADLGISRYTLRALASEPDPRAQTRQLQASCGLYLAVFTVLVVLLPAVLFVIPRYILPVPEDDQSSLRWIIVFSVMEYGLSVPIVLRQNYCSAIERFDRFAAFNLASGIARYCVLFAGILLFANPVAVVGLVVARRALDWVLAERLLGGMPSGSLRPRFGLTEFKVILGHSARLLAGQTLQALTISVGSILVNLWFGLGGLGRYRAAFDLSTKVWFLSNGLGLVLFPRFAKNVITTEAKASFREKFIRLLRVSSAGFGLVATVGVIAAPWLLRIARMEDSEIVGLFVVLLFGTCLNAHSNIGFTLLQATASYRALIGGGSLSLLVLCWSFFAMHSAEGRGSPARR
jgi:O-antigen/teichoic acid export membrane protein